MAGLIRGACVTGGWAVEQTQRDSFVARLADNILSAAFHYKKEVGDPAARAKSIEARAYATAQVASTTTSGARPRVEGVRIYTREAAKLVQALLLEADAAGKAPAEAPAGDAQLLSLQSSDREFLTKERAAELLAPLLAPGATHSKVKLSTKSFGRDAAQVAASAFAALGAQLKHADLSDVMAGRPEAEALEALALMCGALTEAAGVTLESLDLSDNALGEKGVRAAGAALTGQPRLKALTLANDGISAHAAKALAELLASAACLEKLHLYNNMTGDEGAAHLAGLLAKCSAMKDFRIVSSRVADAGAAALLGALASHGRLERLDLCDNGLGPKTGPHLAALVRASSSLTALLLNEVGLRDSGLTPLCEALPVAKALRRLELCCNEITPRGARALAAPLAALPALVALRVAENELGDDGAAALSAALAAAAAAGAPPMEELDMSANALHGCGARAAAAAAVARRCAKLGLDGNEISAAGVAAVRVALKKGLGSDVALGPMEDNDEDADEEEVSDADGECGEDADLGLDMGKATL